MAEIDHPRFLNDAISTSSSGVNIEAGLLLHAGVVLVDHQRQGEPTPTGGCSEVGRFSEQLWGDPRERGQLVALSAGRRGGAGQSVALSQGGAYCPSDVAPGARH